MIDENQNPEFHDIPIDLDKLFLRGLDASLLRKKSEETGAMSAAVRRQLLAIEQKIEEWSDKGNQCCPFTHISDAAIAFLQGRGFQVRKDKDTSMFMVSW